MVSLENKIYQMAEKAGIPIAVHFDLTYRCILRCEHCYLPEKDRYPSSVYREELKKQNRSELTTQEVYGILDQLAECGTLFICFSGGEIFVRRDIMDIIQYAKEKRFNVSLMTTGAAGFDESVADKLADMGVHVVDISLYSGESEVHDSITGIPGSFSKTIEAIEWLSGRDIKVRLKCPLMKKNIGTYKSLIELAESYEADWAFDPNLSAGNDGDKRPTYLRIDDDELEYYFSDMMERYKNKREKSMQDARETPAPECYDPSDQNPCGASHSSCYISPYGDVRPCLSIAINCGNLRDKPFKDIWENSEDMLNVRAIKTTDLRKCPDCPETGYCHRCIADAYVEHGDLLAPSGEACRRKKINHEIKRRLSANG